VRNVRLPAAALVTLCGVAKAGPALVALASGADPRKAVALGPAGEAYEPDGHGGWARTRQGGIAGEITDAAMAGAHAIALVKGGPPFQLGSDGWTVLYLGQHVTALLGAGSRPTAAVGKQVFALDAPVPRKLPDAPGAVAALAASPSGVVAQTDKGLVRLEGTAWKPIKGAPKHIALLVSDRWAISDGSAIDLKTAKMFAIGPANLATTAGDDLIVLGGPSLVTVHAGKVTKEPVALPRGAHAVGLAADRSGRAVIALSDGALLVKDKTWSTVTVHDEPAPPRPGPGPAQTP
jgi:hypothetical protein